MRLHQSSRVVDACDQASSDFRVQRTGVTGLVDFEDFLDPSDDLVGGWIRGLVEVDHTVLLEDVDGPVGGRVSAWQRREVGCLDVELIEVLHKRASIERQRQNSLVTTRVRQEDMVGEIYFLL